MAKTENGYCPEGECDCLEPCEMTAEDYDRMIAETEPAKGDFDCCIPRGTKSNVTFPSRCSATTHFAGRAVQCAGVTGHPGNHTDPGVGLAWLNKDEILESVEAVDMVNHPPHYSDCGQCRQCGSKVEVIQITEGMGFNLGNAVKYVLRCDKKHDAIEDLKKAVWYLEREIERRERAS